MASCAWRVLVVVISPKEKCALYAASQQVAPFPPKG